MMRIQTEEPRFATTSAVVWGTHISTFSAPLSGGSGGDWCEAFTLGERRLAISIGDVCGHDRQAAAEMRGVRGRIRAELPFMKSPSHVLSAVNDGLCASGGRRYATGALAVIDIDRRTLAFASAGHPRPVLAERTSVRFLGTQRGNLPLGVQMGADFDQCHVGLPEDALLIFFTDGVTDGRAAQGIAKALLFEAASAAYGTFPDPTRAFALRLGLGREPAADDSAVIAVRIVPSRGKRSR